MVPGPVREQALGPLLECLGILAEKQWTVNVRVYSGLSVLFP